MSSLTLLFVLTLLYGGEAIRKKEARYVMRCNDGKYTRLKYSKLVAPVPFTIPKKGEFDHIFYKEYLQDCDLDRACVIDLMDASNNGNDEYVKHYLEPGTVFMLPASSKKPKTWLVKNILDLFDKYNASSKDYVLVHVSDESSHWNDEAVIQFYKEWKKVYRQTWHFSKEYTELNEAGRLDWIPITHLRTPNLTIEEMIPASKRIHNITFRGNTKTNQGRRYHWKELQKVLRLRNNASLTGKVIRYSAYSTDPSKGTFLNEMTNSKLCLGMKGMSPECYRFYESLECGCIPLFIDKYFHVDYYETFLPWKSKLMEVPWRKGKELPFIWVRNVSEFAKVYDELFMSGPSGLKKLDVIQQESLEWWAAAKRHFKELFEHILCSFNEDGVK